VSKDNPFKARCNETIILRALAQAQAQAQAQAHQSDPLLNNRPGSSFNGQLKQIIAEFSMKQQPIIIPNITNSNHMILMIRITTWLLIV